jgi:hypothetical protein
MNGGVADLEPRVIRGEIDQRLNGQAPPRLSCVELKFVEHRSMGGSFLARSCHAQ